MNVRDHRDVIEILKHISMKGTKGISTEALMTYYQSVKDLRFNDNTEVRSVHLTDMGGKDNNRYKNTAVVALQLRGVKKEDLGIKDPNMKDSYKLPDLKEIYSSYSNKKI